MGEAKRRKQLDPNFGKEKEFLVEFLEKDEDNFIIAKVVDVFNKKEGIAKFHVKMRANKKVYADVAIFSEDTKWIGENIDKLSPIVCNKFLEDVDILIYYPA